MKISFFVVDQVRPATHKRFLDASRTNLDLFYHLNKILINKITSVPIDSAFFKYSLIFLFFFKFAAFTSLTIVSINMPWYVKLFLFSFIIIFNLCSFCQKFWDLSPVDLPFLHFIWGARELKPAETLEKHKW